MDAVKVPEISKGGDRDINKKRLYVVLELASLSTFRVRGGDIQLLSTDKHMKYLQTQRRGSKVKEGRPDISHQCLLTLLDSPLNKAGLLKVFIHTEDNVLIDVHPSLRIPRTYQRFSHLMVQLLENRHIKDTNNHIRLLSIIKNPIENHLPPGAVKFGGEYSKDPPVHLPRFITKECNPSQPYVFAIGACAKASIHHLSYVDRFLSFSQYPLTASVACGKVCQAFEDLYDIL